MLINEASALCMLNNVALHTKRRNAITFKTTLIIWAWNTKEENKSGLADTAVSIYSRVSTSNGWVGERIAEIERQ